MENNENISPQQTINYSEKVSEIVIQGKFLNYGGFPRLNRSMAFSLSNKGIIVKLEILDTKIQINDSTIDQIKILGNTKVKPTTTKIFSGYMDDFDFEDQLSDIRKNILYTKININTLQDSYAQKVLTYFDEIWVTTKEEILLLKELFPTDHGPKILYMPIGVDLQRYHAGYPKLDFDFPLKDFKFAMFLKSDEIEYAYENIMTNYLDQFLEVDNVSLIILNRDFNEDKMPVIKEIYKRIIGNNKKIPHVIFYTEPISEYNMPKVYSSIDVLVNISDQPHLGYSVLEAASSKIPIIYHNQYDNPSLYTDETLYNIEHIEDLGLMMRYVCDNYFDTNNRSENLYNIVKSNYDFNKVITKIANRILEL